MASKAQQTQQDEVVSDEAGEVNVNEAGTDTSPLGHGDLVQFDQDGKEYKTSGKTLVRARTGYAFASSDRSLPVVTEHGVYVTQGQATSLLEESDRADGRVYIEEED